jgi:hypothetical protein
MSTLRKTLGLGFFAIIVLGAAGLNAARSELPNHLQAAPCNLGAPAAVRHATPDADSYCGIREQCHVDSRVNASIRVYINGVYRGTMGPFGDIYPIVRDLSYESTELYAVSTCGRYSWRMTVRGDFRNYQWILYP